MRASSADVWRDLFVGRLVQLQSRLTAEFAGVIQFEIAQSGRTPRLWFLRLGSGSVVAQDGVCAGFDEWVRTTESDLERILFGSDSPHATLRTTGSRNLLSRLGQWMTTNERPRRAGTWRGGIG